MTLVALHLTDVPLPRPLIILLTMQDETCLEHPPFGEGSKVTTTMTTVDQFGAVPFS